MPGPNDFETGDSMRGFVGVISWIWLVFMAGAVLYAVGDDLLGRGIGRRTLLVVMVDVIFALPAYLGIRWSSQRPRQGDQELADSPPPVVEKARVARVESDGGHAAGLIGEWSRAAGQWDAGAPPYVLAADADFVESHGTVTYRSAEEAREASDFHHPDRNRDRRLHVGLLPVPFMGDLFNASVYVLMACPGVTRRDYDEYEQPAFRKALLANLKQEHLEGFLPFPSLDPQFDWHDGFTYWNTGRGLGNTIGELAGRLGISRAEARAILCERLAVIQVAPYHSANPPRDNRALGTWPSVRLAGEFVRDVVVPKVRSGEAVVLSVLRVRFWDQYLPADLGEEEGVLRSANAGESRSASLGPNSRWGQAILRRLGDGDL